MIASNRNSNNPFLRNEFSKFSRTFLRWHNLDLKSKTLIWRWWHFETFWMLDLSKKITQAKWDSWVPSDSLEVKKIRSFGTHFWSSKFLHLTILGDILLRWSQFSGSLEKPPRAFLQDLSRINLKFEPLEKQTFHANQIISARLLSLYF